MFILQTDNRTGNPKIWIFKDRVTGEPKTECTVAYEEADTANSAVQMFHGTYT